MLHRLYTQGFADPKRPLWPMISRHRVAYPDGERQPRRPRHWANR